MPVTSNRVLPLTVALLVAGCGSSGSEDRAAASEADAREQIVGEWAVGPTAAAGPGCVTAMSFRADSTYVETSGDSERKGVYAIRELDAEGRFALDYQMTSANELPRCDDEVAFTDGGTVFVELYESSRLVLFDGEGESASPVATLGSTTDTELADGERTGPVVPATLAGGTTPASESTSGLPDRLAAVVEPSSSNADAPELAAARGPDEASVEPDEQDNEASGQDELTTEPMPVTSAEESAPAPAAPVQVAQSQAAQAQAESAQAAREQAQREQAAAEQTEREQAEREKLEREQTRLEQAEQERAEQEQAQREELALVQARQEQAVREQAEQEERDREQAAREQAELEREQSLREEAVREQVELEEAAREQTDQDQIELALAESGEPELARAEEQREEEQRAEEQRAEEQRAEEQRAEEQSAEEQRAEEQRAEERRAEEQRVEVERAEQERAERDGASGGIPIEQDDWTFSRGENLKFGDHSGDAGFVRSRPGDNDSTRAMLARGSNYGTGSYFVLPDRTQEAWVSLCLRMSTNWTTSVAGKLPGFAGDSTPTNGGQGGNPANGLNAWSARMLYGPFDSDKQAIPLGQYIYHSDQGKISQYGDSDWWAPLPHRLVAQAARARHNQWHALKQRIRVNTPGNNDGLIEAWFDGELVYSRGGLHFTNNEEFREVYRFWLDVYHGGGATSPYDQYVYFDQVNYSVGSDSTSVDCRN